MAGRKQHYIPQSVLRGFGTPRSGKKVQVVVYDGTRGIFPAATDGVAAERYFYSELDVEGDEPTLDDRITDHEGQMAEVVQGLREASHVQVGAREAAELVTHLSVRNAHLRASFRSATEGLVGQAEALFTDRGRSRAAFGLDEVSPKGIAAEELNKMWAKLGPQAEARGISKELIFEMMKVQFESNFSEISGMASQVLGKMKEGLGDAAEAGHLRALNQSLAPEARIEVLQKLCWTVECAPEQGAVLPDCVVVAETSEGPAPLMYCKSDDVLGVYMPLSHDRILLGSKGSIGALPDMINDVSASCSWDFFVARDRTEALEALVPSIRSRTSHLTEEAIEEALKEYQ